MNSKLGYHVFTVFFKSPNYLSRYESMDRQAILMTLDVILYFPEIGVDMYYDDRLWKLFNPRYPPAVSGE